MFGLILVVDTWVISYETAFRWMLPGHTNDGLDILSFIPCIWYIWRCRGYYRVFLLSTSLESYPLWWRHQMEKFSALLAFWSGNSPVYGEFPGQRPVTRSLDAFFDLRPVARLVIGDVIAPIITSLWWHRWFGARLHYLYFCINSMRRWLTHICVSKITITGSDNGLSSCRRQANIETNTGILVAGPLRTNFSEIVIEIHIFSWKKIHFKLSSGNWRPFCLGLNELNHRHSL